MDKKVSNLICATLILIFIIIKWPSLSLPYFWDEAWSYIPAISQMAKNTPCLLPGCLDIDLYRGHPLFYYFLASGWMKFIGSSLLSMHFFALLISVLFIISFFKLLQLILSPKWVLLGTALMIAQEVFFVQSSFVLPEVLIMTLTIASIRCYWTGNKGLFFLYGCLLGLTKETGIIIGISFVLFDIVKWRGIRRSSYWISLSLIPAIIFYGLQKIQLGWFFYPLHWNLMDYSITSVGQKTGIILKFIFLEQGRRVFFLLLSLLLITPILKKSNKKYAVYLIALLVLIFYTLLTSTALSIFLSLLLLIFLYSKLFTYSKTEKELLLLIGLLIVPYFIFSILNFLMLRYLLLFIPIFVLIICLLLQKIVTHSIFFSVVGTFLIINFAFTMIYNYHYKSWHDDASINYINAVNVHQKAIQYCEQMNFFGKNIYTHFLLQQDLTKPELGYLSTSKPFTDVHYKEGLKLKEDIIIFSCIELSEENYNNVRNAPGYKLVQRFEKNKAWTEIYAANNSIPRN